MSSARPTILVQLGHFRPKLRANGPNRSFARIAAALSDEVRFRVISEAEAGDPIGVWHELDGCERIALRPGRPVARGLARLLYETPHQLTILNGFFNRSLTLPTLLLKKLGRERAPLLLAPRGEFSPGALHLKALPKQVYVALMRHSGLLNGVSIQATDDREAAGLRAALPGVSVLVGPNVRTIDPLPEHRDSKPGALLRIAFLSRIDRMKNLDWAISCLGSAGLPIAFDIFGPIFDPTYWAECQALIAKAPATVTISYRGPVAPEDVPATLAEQDLFILPTRGENFGHAIADTLLAGTPALIADTTPWRGLEASRAGADLPLADMATWHRFLTSFAAQSPTERKAWRLGARALAEARLDTAADTDRLVACFRTAMGMT